MTHHRNVEGLCKSAQLRHQQTRQKAEEGIRRVVQEGRPVNFKTVAETAQVSPAWLYQQPDLRGRIEHLRQQTRTPRPSPPEANSTLSDASREAMLATLRLRVKQLEAENRELKQQIEVLYGQLFHPPS